MVVPDFQRARSAAAKQLRESAILEAARALGAERGTRQVTLTDIGEAVGLHKSAILRYFETREEIVLAVIVVVVRHLLPGLTVGDGVDLIAAATALSGAFWQMATPGPEVAALYRSDPRLAHAVVDVEPRVNRLLTAMLAGERARLP